MSNTNGEPSSAKQEEARQLKSVQSRLERALKEADDRLQAYQEDIQSQKEYLWNNRDEMDHIEKIASRDSIQQAVTTGEFVYDQRKRMLKLRQSPYFGRFDFQAEDERQARPVYIGVHHFYDEFDKEHVVFDWRAPIASMFYDYETGPARFEAPDGTVSGDIQLKRQFRIRNGQIELMIDSAVNVVDDVLQDELGRATDDGMKNIVATIQRDQNAIIRNDQAKTLIIQGVAGSGKTSIALHRIAFLLYRFKDTLTSEDILIISPNRVFADYISNVLPELGEETVNEIGMETLAKELLKDQYQFQTFFEQTAEILEKNDDEVKRRLRYKASPDFLKQLGRYADEVEKNRFVTEDLWIARRLVPGWLLEETFRKHRNLDTTARINQVAREMEQKIGIQYNYDLMPEQRKELKAAIKGMVKQSTLRETYKRFFEWAGQPEMFRPAKGSKLEYADVFPLIYLKMRLEGIRSPYRNVKHLLIDEMQDYTPVQYAVMARLFSCKKTILGDAYQSVNPYSSSATDDIRTAFRDATCVTLNKSYRSSYEIARFAQRISPNPDLEIIERHGEEPEVLSFGSRKKEIDTIKARIAEFENSRFNTLGIICKTQKQARRMHKALEGESERLQLLSEDSQSFAPGVIVCTAHLAKGLEFDHVILPEVTEANYYTDMDRNLLYVGCTRAMHQLTLTTVGKATAFVAPG
ncbi:UvrD-helicase domain-containing protein [Marinobacter sp. ATCH36]|uniref:HelD family protein n=1 Tax=Marinobacter sp. ATCH36 TaxID=2945106 RepID=UPI002022999E|nr:UvrD-helicase domain-containing protein [Marinobacter sp. ATCH36]MCL7945517.1 AAA family ATPase [Marinobacter sp. ATCH36]